MNWIDRRVRRIKTLLKFGINGDRGVIRAQEILRDAKRRHKEAATLVRLEYYHSYDVTDYEWLIRNPKILALVGLEPEDITPEVVSQAKKILHDLDDELREWVGEFNDRGRQRTEDPDDDEPAPQPRPQPDKRSKLFGFPVTAVVRWMGKEGWSPEDTMKVLRKLGHDLQMGTIRIQLKAGKTGERGEPAGLTEEQANTLYDNC